MLDVYLSVEGSHDPSPGGLTLLGNETPGYGPKGMLLPQEDEEPSPLSFPPRDLRKMGPEWPIWRIELRHEVCHQFQHLKLGRWNPRDGTGGHSEGWPQTIAVVADAFGWPADDLRRVVDG